MTLADDIVVDRLSTREGYDRWAAIYDDEDNPLVALEQPHIDALLGPGIGPGMTIADIGCGTGRHALRLAAAGARVTALDFSEQMLNRARAKCGSPALEGGGWGAGEARLHDEGVEAAHTRNQDSRKVGRPTHPLAPSLSGRGNGFTFIHRINFIHHDLAKPLPLANHSFDRVLCGLVLDHIDDLDLLFSEMKRISKPDGAIIISIMHPAMMLRGIQARFTDPQTGRETRPRSVPNQISDYVMAATRAGLAFDHISEHSVDEALAIRCPRARKYLGWPLLLVMRLTPSAKSAT